MQAVVLVGGKGGVTEARDKGRGNEILGERWLGGDKNDEKVEQDDYDVNEKTTGGPRGGRRGED